MTHGRRSQAAKAEQRSLRDLMKDCRLLLNQLAEAPDGDQA